MLFADVLSIGLGGAGWHKVEARGGFAATGFLFALR